MSARADRLLGGALVLLGAAAALEASTYDVGFMTDPVGPKALPYLVAATVTLAGLVALVRPRARVRLPDRVAVWRMLGAVLAFMLYAAALPWLGFFASTALVVATLSLLFRGPPLASCIVATALSGALWLLFVQALSLPLPIGDLWIR